MTPSSSPSQARLFCFIVPGIEDSLAVPIEQMVGVDRLPFVTRVPAAPPSVLGIGRWLETPVVLFDLQMILAPRTRPDSLHDVLGYHHLIIKVAIHNQISLVGCPIMPGGQMVNVPMSLPRVDIPASIAAGVVHQAVLIDDRPVLLLNTLHFPLFLAQPQPIQ